MINKKYIRKVDKYLSLLKTNDFFYVGISNHFAVPEVTQLELDGYFLPNEIGKVSKFNSSGKQIIRRDLGFETCFRDATITDWHDNQHNCTISYQRYKREQILPPLSKWCSKILGNGDSILHSELLQFTEDNSELIKHNINLLLEHAGECELYTIDFEPIIRKYTIKVEWEILAAGHRDKDATKIKLDGIISQINASGKSIFRSHIHYLNGTSCDEIVVGQNEFAGYIGFIFKDKNIGIFENPFYGNATYLMENWEEGSKLNKQQLQKNGMLKCRIIHNDKWYQNINKYVQ